MFIVDETKPLVNVTVPELKLALIHATVVDEVPINSIIVTEYGAPRISNTSNSVIPLVSHPPNNQTTKPS